MTRILVFLAAVTALPSGAYAQAGTATKSTEPFKVGTFLIGNAERVGIVLRDALVACCQVELDRQGGVVDYRPHAACDACGDPGSPELQPTTDRRCLQEPD